MGGAFRKVQTVDRLGLAAINGTNGSLLAWSPSVTIPGTTTVPIVRSMALERRCRRGRQVHKRERARGGPQSEPNQARFDATTGARKPWADNYAFLSYGIVSDGTNYYVAAGGPGGSILRYGPTGGQSRVSTDGDVQAIGLFEGQVIAGGHFLLTSGKDILRLAALSTGGVLDTSWRPNPNGTDSGTGRSPARAPDGSTWAAASAPWGNGAFKKFAQFGGGSPGTPTTVRALPDADAMVKEGSPSSNYVEQCRPSRRRRDRPGRRELPGSLVSGLSGGPVQSARLRLWATSATTNGPAAYSTTNAWAEGGAGGITWATRPARTSPPTDDKASVPGGAWVEFDVTSSSPATARSASCSRAPPRTGSTSAPRRA